MIKTKANRNKKINLPYLESLQQDGRITMEVDIDRMVNEGLGGGYVIPHVNGSRDSSTPPNDLMD